MDLETQTKPRDSITGTTVINIHQTFALRLSLYPECRGQTLKKLGHVYYDNVHQACTTYGQRQISQF